ncbi:fluoride efflux transporter FluC [Streptacidiphilus griseoplanus]|uniref:fluoride efflux transporter FluC n=1 Tax=Peterkaempfera griseoplana TaxID=66896 RepID=UPI000A86374D|nr:CrcB family protein [Peterkaempfera griseoplana]
MPRADSPQARRQPEPRSAAPAAGRAGRPRGQWDVLAVIALGGGIGSLGRYGLARALPTPPGGFPWATFVTNVAGSFALGLLMVYVLDVWPPSRHVRPFLGVGVLGGFTTFSTYTVETRGLLAAHSWALAGTYAFASLAVGLAAVWAGGALGRHAARTAASRPSPAGTAR